MNNRGLVPVIAVIFIGLFAMLLGGVMGNSTFDKGLPTHQDEASSEYK